MALIHFVSKKKWLNMDVHWSLHPLQSRSENHLPTQSVLGPWKVMIDDFLDRLAYSTLV